MQQGSGAPELGLREVMLGSRGKSYNREAFGSSSHKQPVRVG